MDLYEVPETSYENFGSMKEFKKIENYFRKRFKTMGFFWDKKN